MKLTIRNQTHRHPQSPVIHLTPQEPYPAPAGFEAVPYSDSHDALPVAVISEPVPVPNAEELLAAGVEVAGRRYDLSTPAQNAWANSLTVLREAETLGAITASTPVDAIIGPVLDIDGKPVPSMTVHEYRLLLLTQLMPKVAELRAKS